MFRSWNLEDIASQFIAWNIWLLDPKKTHQPFSRTWCVSHFNCLWAISLPTHFSELKEKRHITTSKVLQTWGELCLSQLQEDACRGCNLLERFIPCSMLVNYINLYLNFTAFTWSPDHLAILPSSFVQQMRLLRLSLGPLSCPLIRCFFSNLCCNSL